MWDLTDVAINYSEAISAGSPSCEIRDPSAEKRSPNLVMKISGDCRGLNQGLLEFQAFFLRGCA